MKTTKTMRANPLPRSEPRDGNTTGNHPPLAQRHAVPRRFPQPAALLALVLATGLWAVTLLHPPTALAAAPVTLTLKGQWPGYARGPAQDVAVQGQYAYVVAESGGLQVIDISDPANPVRVGGYHTSGTAWSVAVAGNYAFVGDDDGGLQVIDISDPANPMRVGGIDTSGGGPGGVTVAGNHAYVTGSRQEGTNWIRGLQVIDVSNPVNPVRVGGYDISGVASGVAVAGNHAYVTERPLWGPNLVGRAGLWVIDVSNPANPVRVGGYDTGASDVAVVGDLIYVTVGTRGLLILEQSRPLWLEVSGRNPFTISVSGEPGTAVRLQRSLNLRDWEDWQSATLADVPLQFPDPDAAGATTRFYRAVKQ